MARSSIVEKKTGKDPLETLPAGAGQCQARPRGRSPPRRRRHLPGAGRGPSGPPPPWRCAGWSPLRASAREKTMTERLANETARRHQQPRRRGQEARRHAQDGRSQPRLRALPLVNPGSTSAFEPAPSPGGRSATVSTGRLTRGPQPPPIEDTATSASWRTSTPARPRRPSASSTTPARSTRSAKSTTAPPPWTGWSRSRSAASPSPPPPPPASGTTTQHQHHRHPRPRRLHRRGRALAARARRRGGRVRRQRASSRSPRRSGARPTSTTSRASCFVNKMDKIGADFYFCVESIRRPPGRQRRADPASDRRRGDLQGHRRPGRDEGDGSGTARPLGEKYRRSSKSPPTCRTRPPSTAQQADRDRRRDRRRRCMEQYLDGEELDGRRDQERASASARSDRALRPGAVRLGVQEQGRAADARRGRRLSALAAGRAGARARPRTSEDVESAAPSDDEPFSGWRSRSWTDPFFGTLTFCRSIRASSNPATALLNSDQGQEGARRAQAARCTPTTAKPSRRPTPATSSRLSGLKDTRTGDTLCDPNKPGRAGDDGFPRSGHRGRRSSPRPRPTRRSWAWPCRSWPQEDPSFRVSHRPRDRPDHHQRHGRAAPGDHGRLACARLQGRGQRRQAAGGLPRDHQRPAPRSTTPTRSRPAARASSRASRSISNPGEPGAGFKFENEIIGGRCPRNTFPAWKRACEHGQGKRRAGRLPGDQLQGRA